MYPKPMRPTTVQASKLFLPRALTRTFNDRAGKQTPPGNGPPPQYIPRRLAIMNREFTLPATSRGDDCPGYLFDFLTDTPLPNEPVRAMPRSQWRRTSACRPPGSTRASRTTKLRSAWADAQARSEDPELVPTITLGSGELPRHATYDVVCSTDNHNAMGQLCRAFGDSTCQIRGLRLEFGFKEVTGAPLKDILVGVKSKRHLTSIQLKITWPTNYGTAAETEVFRAIGANSSIKHLSVKGRLNDKHRPGVITALSNASLEHVTIKADELSCLRMLDWAADTGPVLRILDGPSRSLRITTPPLSHPFGSKMDRALAKWNAAVVRLAESGSTKSLHLPKEIKQALTPETLKVVEAYGMDVFAT